MSSNNCDINLESDIEELPELEEIDKRPNHDGFIIGYIILTPLSIHLKNKIS
jgi:hypothetical protein